MKLGLVLNPPASFQGEPHIPSTEEFLQAAHDVFELATIAHKLRLSAGTLLLGHVSVVMIVMTEFLLASCTFPMVG